jgi:hypothetical protein
MNCCDCHEQLADLSAGILNAQGTQAVQFHLEQCGHCSQEWVVFERTLFLVSTTQQVLPSPLASEQMWHQCMEHIFEKVEAERLQASPVNVPAGQGWRGWVVRQPRWSWAGLAGAFALFGAVWFMAPHGDAAYNDAFPPEGQLVALQNPPAVAAGLINHHAVTTVDPFNDYAGKTLVSYSVAPPARTRP